MVTGQVEEAFAKYSNSIAQLERSAWRYIKDVVQKRYGNLVVLLFILGLMFFFSRKAKNRAKGVLQEELNEIVLVNRLGELDTLSFFSN